MTHALPYERRSALAAALAEIETPMEEAIFLAVDWIWHTHMDVLESMTREEIHRAMTEHFRMARRLQ